MDHEFYCYILQCNTIDDWDITFPLELNGKKPDILMDAGNRGADHLPSKAQKLLGLLVGDNYHDKHISQDTPTTAS